MADGLATSRIDVPIGAGLHEAVDKHWVQAGSFLRMENWVVDQAGALRKRHGYAPLANTLPASASIPEIARVDVRSNELVAIGNDSTDAAPHLYSWSEALGRWTDKSDVCPASVARSPVARARSRAYAPHVCVAGGLEVYTWAIDPDDDAVNTGIYIKAIDPTTGGTVVNDTLLVGSLDSPHHVTFACGDDVLVAYVAGTQLIVRKWSTTTLATASITVIATNSDERYAFDAVPYGASQFVIAWMHADADNTVVIKLYDESPMTVAASDSLVRTEIQAVALNADPSQNLIALVAGDAFAPWWYVVLSVYDGLLAPQYNVEAYDSGANAQTPTVTITSAAVAINADGSFEVLFDGRILGMYGPGPDSIDSVGVFIRHINSGGGSPLDADIPRRAERSRILSRPFVRDGATYCLLSGIDRPSALGIATGPNSFHAMMLVRLDTSTAEADPVRLEAAFCVGDAYTPVSDPTLPKSSVVQTTTASEMLFAAMVMTSGTTLGQALVIGTDDTASSGVDRVALDFSMAQAPLWQGAQAQGLLAQSGGIAASYDGQTVTELGYLAAPLIRTAAVYGAPGDGAIEGGTPGYAYGYVAVFEWVDSQGNLHQSAPSETVVVSVSTAETGAKIELVIDGLAFTRRGDPSNGDNRDVTIAVFRTLKNAPELYYRTTRRTAPVAINNRVNTTSTVYDTISDTSLLASGYGVLYTAGGVLENLPPGPVKALTRHRDRLWLVSSDDDRNVLYSKSLTQGEAPGFHPAFSVRVDGETGVTAVAGLDDKVVFFTESAVSYVVGDGPADNGAGGLYNGPYPIASDSGCSDPRSVVSFPGGIAFQSNGDLRVLTRGLTIESPGMAVQLVLRQYPTIVGAVVDGTREWLVWLANNGTGASVFIVWDYRHGAWFTWDISGSAEQFSHTLWRGYHVYADAGAVCREAYGALPGYDPGENYPEGYLEYPWLHPGDAINGFQRVRHLLFAIQRLGDCFLTISTFADWNESAAADSQTFDFNSTSDIQGLNSTAILDMHLGTQECSVLKIQLHDTGPVGRSTSSNPTGILVAGLTLEVGRKAGRPYVSPANRK
jgi:hypothetical protein